jgi:hypothetical protein
VRQQQEHLMGLEPDHHRIIGTVKKVHRHKAPSGGFPRTSATFVTALAHHVLADAGSANVDVQLEEFSMDSRCARLGQ